MYSEIEREKCGSAPAEGRSGLCHMLRTPLLRRPLLLCMVIMCAQIGTACSVVFMYSTSLFEQVTALIHIQ